MKTVDIAKLRQLDAPKLQLEADRLRNEISKQLVNMKMKTEKNTNVIPALKRELAVVLTVLREKRT